jgi:hypothetical protein
VGPDAAGDARFDAASRATRRGSYGATRELAGWVATGVEPTDVPVARSAMRDMLQSVASGGAGELGYRATGDGDIDGIYAQIEAGGQIPASIDGADLSTGNVGDGELHEALPNWSLSAIRDRVHRIDEAELARAAAAAFQVQTVQGTIILFRIARVTGHMRSSSRPSWRTGRRPSWHSRSSPIRRGVPGPTRGRQRSAQNDGWTTLPSSWGWPRSLTSPRNCRCT